MRPMNSKETPVEGEVEVEEVEVEEVRVKLGCYTGFVKLVEDPSEEIMLLWGLQQPIFSKPNAFVKQSSLSLHLDAFGHSISVLQSPSSLVILSFISFSLLVLNFIVFLLLMCFYLTLLIENLYGIMWGFSV